MEEMDLNRLCYLIVKKNEANKERLAQYRELRKIKEQRKQGVKENWDKLISFSRNCQPNVRADYEDQHAQHHFLKHFRIGKKLDRMRHAAEGKLFECQDSVAELAKQIKPILRHHNLIAITSGNNNIQKLIYKTAHGCTIEKEDIKRNAEWYLIERDILS
jgi:hypothetical protein